MKVDFYKPKNNFLQEYIEGYYFVVEDRHSKPISYFTFPNNFCILSFYQNAEELFSKNQYLVKSSKHQSIVASLFSRYSKPLEIIYENLVNEITIYFKTIKINHFIDDSIIFQNGQISNYTPFPDFKEKMVIIFQQSSRDKQIALLEDYLLSKFIKKDFSLIEQILSDLDEGLKLDDISDKYNFTRQYINKIFSKAVGKTPSEYRKIQRFRNVLTSQRINSKLINLSNNNLYFDQSHFNKDFKELTNSTPSAFFKKVEIDRENIWLNL